MGFPHSLPLDLRSVAIVGGGPGGLMTAYLMNQRFGSQCRVTLYESGTRLGGKIVTRRFETVDAQYEAGAAELYDYSQLGPDPLRELIAEFGLKTSPMNGPTVVMDNRILNTDADIQREFGAATLKAINDFHRRCKVACSPAEYYESDWKSDNEDPLSRQSFAQFLDTIQDETARKYIAVAVHSDVATEPHHTSASYGLQNWLMNDPKYMQLYTINGGIERLPQELTKRIDADVKLQHRVQKVGRTSDGKYRVSTFHRGVESYEDFDFVVVALPQNWLMQIDWQGDTLARAMRAHTTHYDHPAHYLRVSMAFEKPFWRSAIAGSFFMLDAFEGCCVYDESSRDPACQQGVLGWLISGTAATTMANLDDARLVEAVLDSLPASMREHRSTLLEARIHRWLGAVNGKPMGYPVREPDSRHIPDPTGHPGLYLVGDYLFDSTLNGVLDSADTVVECIRDDIQTVPSATLATPQGVGR